MCVYQLHTFSYDRHDCHQSMAIMRNPKDTYMSTIGYTARDFLLVLIFVLMKGYAAQELQASATQTTTTFNITLSFSMQIKAPTSSGNR